MDLTPFSDPILRHVFFELTTRYDCHTVILYGSRARGDFTSDSDYDLVGIRADGAEARVGEIFDGHFLDAFVYPEAKLAENEEKLLRIRGGKILVERGEFGKSLLTRIEARYARGPEKLTPDELTAQVTWIRKTLSRARRGDIEGNFRRAWLLHELLAFAFETSGRWYRGPKEGFRELADEDPEGHQLYAAALAAPADHPALEKLVAHFLKNYPEKTHVQ